MARETERRQDGGNAFTKFFVRVDEALTPIFESRPGPSDEGPPQSPNLEAPCPVCGAVMRTHHFEEEYGGNIILICPTDERLPERAANGPVNELGMPATGRRLEQFEAEHPPT